MSRVKQLFDNYISTPSVSVPWPTLLSSVYSKSVAIDSTERETLYFMSRTSSSIGRVFSDERMFLFLIYKNLVTSTNNYTVCVKYKWNWDLLYMTLYMILLIIDVTPIRIDHILLFSYSALPGAETLQLCKSVCV